MKSPLIPFALSVLMVATSVGATEYTLREGCALRKFEGGKWQETDPSVLEGTSVGKLNRHGNRVRFKVEGVWHSAEAKCLVAAADPQSEEELRPSKRYRDSSRDKKKSRRLTKGFSSSKGAIQFFGLLGAYRAMGEGEQFQFAWGGGLQARLGEAFGLKAQITHTSRSGEISTPSGNIKIDLSVSEITVSPTATFGSVYFGPQLGLALVGLSTDAGGSTGSAFEVGGNLGLSFPLSEHVSVGPDFHYTYLPSVLIEGLDLPSANIFKLLFRVSAGF